MAAWFSAEGDGSVGVEDLENQEAQDREDWGGAGADDDDPFVGSDGAGLDGGVCSFPELLVAPIRSSRNLLISGSTSGLEFESVGS